MFDVRCSMFDVPPPCPAFMPRAGATAETSPHCLRAGLTLIEVILATAILGIGMSVLVAATSRCLAVASKAKQYEAARRLIGQVDLEIPPDFEELEEGVESGRFHDPYDGYTWEREITEFEDEELEMFAVRTAVYWNNKGSEAKEEVMTYIYGPTHVRKELAGATR